MTPKRVLLDLADGSPFGPTGVRRVVGCGAKRATRAIPSLVGAGLARPTHPGRMTLYELGPRRRDLGSAVFEWRSDSQGTTGP